MQIDGYVQALREDLARVAAVGDESTARAAELLAVALESALGRRLLAVDRVHLDVAGRYRDIELDGRGRVEAVLGHHRSPERLRQGGGCA